MGLVTSLTDGSRKFQVVVSKFLLFRLSITAQSFDSMICVVEEAESLCQYTQVLGKGAHSGWGASRGAENGIL